MEINQKISINAQNIGPAALMLIYFLYVGSFTETVSFLREKKSPKPDLPTLFRVDLLMVSWLLNLHFLNLHKEKNLNRVKSYTGVVICRLMDF